MTETRSEDKPRLITQIGVVAVSSLAPLCLGFSFGFSSSAGPDLMAVLKLSTDQIAWFTSLVLLGAISGSLIGTAFVEKLGRKTTLVLQNVAAIIGWFLIIMAELTSHRAAVALLYTGRILQGVAVGITCSAQPAYIAEITTKQHRGRMATSFQLSINSGFLLSYVLGIPFYYRWMAIFPLAISVLMTILMFLLPESPRYLLSKGQKDKATKALKWMRGPRYDVQSELQQTQDTLDSQVALGSFHPREFLKPGLYRPLIISLILMIFVDASGITAVLAYSESIFESAGFRGKGDLASVILGFIFVLTVIPASLLTDRTGRRVLLIIGQAIMALSLITLGIYYYITLKHDVRGLNWLSMTSLIAFISAFSLGIGPMSFVVTGEVFPLRARGVGIGICNFTHWVVAFIMTKSYQHMIEALREYGTFWLLGGLAALGLFLTILLVPETKGKTLEDIEKIFNQKSCLTCGSLSECFSQNKIKAPKKIETSKEETYF